MKGFPEEFIKDSSIKPFYETVCSWPGYFSPSVLDIMKLQKNLIV